MNNLLYQISSNILFTKKKKKKKKKKNAIIMHKILLDIKFTLLINKNI